ncbi:ubiquitin C-terminal hydrolase 13-like isoform X4 [Malus domestica]|uniref:ubiquitin C-terminal hydrolase 13-like isoform X4 n=1 Tax=Malus domestica TaxID=3750 RepID=UPI0010AB3F90|nr:ubiquitin carboxyl-terminal hydrolase 13-like isoform X1 [Malus domestica]XP_028946221.1 ubiquitin carboxyl-terminal hydrolase 13-like isoform X1 [Malus domestica]XP_028946222.1 ubiquitin carboxyl-terminal hydrolase 13-like isoform X1 [Malus domestica]
MEVAQVEPACTVDSQPVEDPPAMKFTWTIENFTRLNTKKHYYSDMFVVGGYKWRILIFPKGNNVDYLSMYLDAADSRTLPYGWSRCAQFGLAVVNQIHPKYSIRKDTQHQFNAREGDWGYTSFMLLGDLYDQSRGYLVNDTVVVEAEISVCKVLDYGSYDSKKETGYVGLKNQGANGYMNSLLRTWYHIPYFRKCVHHMPTTEDDMPSGSIPLALQRLFYKLQYSESSVASKELTKSFGPTHDLFVKHDLPELNRVLIKKLEDKMKGTIVEGTIQQLFEGHYRNYIECFNVDYKSTWKESFYDLQLDVKGCRDVYASFSKFLEVKRLEGDNKYHSEELGLQDAKKGVLFIDFPPVLQLQLKRFEYDFMRDTTVKINDRYEFPLQLDLDRENGKYLSPESDKSVRNLYTLHSVLVHSGGVHGGHYHAFIRPTLSDQWYKFGDKCVTKEDVKRALEEQYGGEEETNPDFNNTPFKLTRHSDAYMLVYVRDSDKDKVICNVDEKDIAEHLRIRLKKEQEKEKKERFKEQAHHYTIIKVGQIEGVSNKMHNAELKLFLEVEFGPILRPISLPNKTEEDILLFFKLYEPEKQELRFVGRLFVKSFTKPVEILAKFNQLAGFSLDEEIEIYEEIRFKPSVMCQRLDKMTSFQSSQIEDGDIICFQKSTPLEIDEGCKYPDVPSFLDYVHNRRIVHFHSLEKPTVEDFCLELSKLHTYDDVVEKLAHHIGLEDPTKIRLTAHNCYSQQPRAQPIKYRGVEHLTEMLTHYNQTSDILYYEVFEITLPELQDLKHLKVAFHHATKDEVEIHSIRLPKQSIVGDVINVLKTKVELSHPNAELRLLEVFDHKIYKIFPNSEKIENINNQYWTLRAEEIPEEEKNLGLYRRLIHVFHFTVTVLNQMVDQVQNFGEPFVLVIHEGETLAEVKIRIQKKLQVPDEEFSKWKFAFLSLGRPEYLRDSDIVSSRFQRRDVYGAWEQYLGLEHSDKAPKRAHAANQAAQVTLESMASNVGHETASREIEMQNDDLDGPASPAVDRTLRRLSAAEDLLKSTSARGPSVETLAALDTVSRYARSSLDTLCTNGAYEEFKAALKLVTEQGMIPSTITSMFKDLLSSLDGEMLKYVAAVKELTQAEDFRVEHEGIEVQMGLAMQKCQERKYIVANYDAKVTELEAELVRVKAERAEAMANLETAVDEMEPLKQRFADSSLKSENLIVRQATLTLQKCSSVGTWAVLQDALKKYFKF